MSSFHLHTPLKGKKSPKKKPVVVEEAEFTKIDAEEVLKMYSNTLDQCRETNKSLNQEVLQLRNDLKEKEGALQIGLDEVKDLKRTAISE
jgi:hypothetical protein